MLIKRRFPDNLSFHAVGGPDYITSVLAPSSRIESRDQTSDVGLGRWTVSYNTRLRVRYRELLYWYHVARGKKHTFPFKDWLDFEVTPAEGVLIATGVANQYQLYKLYEIISEEVDSPPELFQEFRKIRLPRTTITIDGGTGVSFDRWTGLVTSTTPPNFWFGEFDCLCRFDTDRMEAEIVDKQQDGQFITDWGSVPFAEVAE